MKKLFWVAGLVSMFVLAPSAQAAEFVMPGQSGQITTAAGETHKNLYTAGNTVVINGPVQSDLTVAGGTITVTGTVDQDLLAAGGTIVASGKVGSNARIAGGNITINGPVAGDLVVAGGTVVISDTATVGGDLLIGGGMVELNGPVTGNIKAAGGRVTINSTVGGRIDVKASRDLVFGPKAAASGTITYKGPRPASVDPSAKISSINFTQQQPRSWHKRAGLTTASFFITLLAWLIASFLLLRLRRGSFQELEETVWRRPWVALGTGLLLLIAVPIAIVILFATLIGYYVAAVVLFAYILMLLLAGLYSALLAGSWLMKRVGKRPQPRDWQIVLVGVLAWTILRLVPVIGRLVIFVVFLMALGAWWLAIWQRMRQNPQ